MTKKEKKDVCNFLIRVMKGEERDSAYSKEEGAYIEIPVSMTLRMKAAELLFKSIDDSEDTANNLPVVIYEDIPFSNN